MLRILLGVCFWGIAAQAMNEEENHRHVGPNVTLYSLPSMKTMFSTMQEKEECHEFLFTGINGHNKKVILVFEKNPGGEREMSYFFKDKEDVPVNPLLNVNAFSPSCQSEKVCAGKSFSWKDLGYESQETFIQAWQEKGLLTILLEKENSAPK